MQGKQDRNPLKRVLANVAFITGSNLLGRLLNLVVLAALGRLFGAEGLGGYSTAVAVAIYFVFVVDLGLSPRIVREGAIFPEQLATEFSKAMGLKVVSAALAVLGLAGLCLVLPYDRWVRELCFLLGCASIVRSFAYLNASVCRARERLDLEGAATLANSFTFVGSTLACFALGYPVAVVGYTSLAAALVQLALSTLMARRFVRLGITLPPDWGTLQRALPYATTSLTLLAFSQIDILVVSMIETQEFVGRYASISRLLTIAGTLGSLAAAAILPTASRLYATASRQQFCRLVNEALRGALLLAGGATLGFAVFARPAISLIYGPDFADLYPILRAGAIFLVPKFCVSVLELVLTSCGRQADRARSVLVGLAATAIFVVVLVPRFGIAGAVAAMVASEVLLLGLFAWYLRDFLRFGMVAKTAATLAVAVPLSAWIHLQLAAEVGWVAVLAAVGAPLLTYCVVTLIPGEAQASLRFVWALRKGRDAASA